MSFENLLNYTQVEELYGEKYNLAPRSHPHMNEFLNYTRTKSGAKTLNHTSGLYFLDMEREA